MQAWRGAGLLELAVWLGGTISEAPVAQGTTAGVPFCSKCVGGGHRGGHCWLVGVVAPRTGRWLQSLLAHGGGNGVVVAGVLAVAAQYFSTPLDVS